MPARQPEGPPPPPTVQRVRVRYARRGRLRFTSHRDFQRALERALRRARVPMAYSAGFSPHPKVSYAGAPQTGVASEAEYLELGLAERRDPAELRAALDAALPDGLDVLEVVEAGPGALADRLGVSHWSVRLPGVSPATAAAAVAELLARDELVVERVTKSGRKPVDVRAALVRAEVTGGEATGGEATGGEVTGAGAPRAAASYDTPGARQAVTQSACAILSLVVRHVTPAVRPDDVLIALRAVAGPAAVELVAAHAEATRLAQGDVAPDGSIQDPLAADRGADPTGPPRGPVEG